MNPPLKPVTSSLSPGTHFGTYEIIEQLGAGGMGEVYRARDVRLDRQVALKTVSQNGRSQADALSRFEQEARSASTLNHPNIVTIYEFGQVKGTHYIAMELVSGDTIRKQLASGPIPFRKVLAIAAQVADALARAHEIGIVHRDLKPDNLMVSADGIAKILDFGLAKRSSVQQLPASASSTCATPVTQSGAILGTLSYMSPEQANGRTIDFRSDQFSLGCVLYEMVTGVPAFQKATSAETVAAILRDAPERSNPRLLQMPAPFVWILERCLAKDPNQRYASTRDLARELAGVRDRVADAPLRHPEPRPSNLPGQRTALIGRQQEVAALRQMLSRDDVRLVTLTGPGGIGKTRLAVQTAGEVAEHFPAGVCFVSLSLLKEQSLLATTIAQALGLRDAGNQMAQDSLSDYLGQLDRPMLLLLDNFEHLVTAASVISDLLSVNPKLKLVVTSQAPLHVYGEHEFPVPPLALPDTKSLQTLNALSHLPSVALFVERARAVKHDFTLTRENAPCVAAICARLDGLPLAIELAGARIKLLSPGAMLARLESSLNLLTGGARDLPTRQQTLRGTVEWSYNLLNPAEQILFRRLSVFVGGCTMEAAEAVCDTGADLGIDVFDGMSSMVDKSLVQQVEAAGGETRFIMLSTIREYALERLIASDEENNIRRCHAAYCLVLAEDGAAESETQEEWLDRFELEHDNFRAALEHLIRTGDADWGLRLGVALFLFWETREHLTEGRTRIGKLLALKGARDHPKLRARLLFAAGILASAQAEYACAQPLLEESIETCLELQDHHGVAVALNALAVNARDRGDLGTASFLFERCVGIWKDAGDPVDIARALSNLASVMKLQGDLARAYSLYEECLSMFRKASDVAGVAWTLNCQGDIARERNDLAGARSLYEQSLSAFSQSHDGWGIASVLSDMASLSCDQSDSSEALRLYGESIRMFQTLGHKRGIARVLECLALNAAAQSNAVQSLRFAGAAAALRKRLGTPLTPTERPKVEKALEFARRALGHAAGSAAWMEGWEMPMEQAIEEALNCRALPEVRNARFG